MHQITSWLSTMNLLVQELNGLDLGYPLGDNSIATPTLVPLDEIAKVSNISLNSEIVQFYRYCNGVSLPDVKNGYFIHAAELLMRAPRKGEPLKMLRQKSEESIFVFGTDGGGGRFAILLASGEVVYLPMDSARNGRYEGTSLDIRIISTDFLGFLDFLTKVTKEFIDSNKV